MESKLTFCSKNVSFYFNPTILRQFVAGVRVEKHEKSRMLRSIKFSTTISIVIFFRRTKLHSKLENCIENIDYFSSTWFTFGSFWLSAPESLVACHHFNSDQSFDLNFIADMLLLGRSLQFFQNTQVITLINNTRIVTS